VSYCLLSFSTTNDLSEFGKRRDKELEPWEIDSSMVVPDIGRDTRVFGSGSFGDVASVCIHLFL